ncbi:MAG: GAF domain-containing protein [Chloroflexota bacterium]|jgi:GAF domain-containing protein/HAMP domain-containing protein
MYSPIHNSARESKKNIRGPVSRRLSLRIKLPLIVILLLILAFIVSTILSIRAAQSALTDTLKGELTAQTATKAELIRTNLVWTRSVAIDLAAAAEVINYDEETILKTISNTLDHNEQIFGSTIAYEPYQFQPAIYYWSPYYSRTSDGLRFTQLGNSTYNYFGWEWYTLPKAKREPVLSPPYFDEGGGEIWMVTWSAPFFDNAGKVKGVATADIAFSQTQEIVSSISVGKNGYAFLLDSQGVILGIGKNGGEYQVMVDSMLSAAESSQTEGWAGLVSTMMAGNTGFADVVDARGQPMFVAYTPVGLDTGWSLALAFPQAELFQKASQLQNTLILYAIFVVIIFSAILYIFTLSITEPLHRLTLYTSRFSPEQLRLTKGQAAEPIHIQTRDELEDLTTAFNQMTTDLYQAFETLEERVNERTDALNKRAAQLRTVADVGKVVVSFRDLSELLQRTAYLIHENFGYYHAGIFLLDEHKEYAVLTATNSPGGQRMLERKHQLKIGETSIVGYTIENTKARIALDVGQDAVFFDNPDLPQTRSEIALPLVIGGQILGALDVQSTEPQAFSEEDISTLQILADQIAVAIQNAKLFEEIEKALEAARIVYGEVSREAWSKILHNQPRIGYIATQPATIETHGEAVEPSLAKAFETGDLILGADGLTISVPIKIRGQAIGAIRLKKSEIAEAWTQDETNLAIALSDQLSGALESARLYRESQQRAARESLVSDISARISGVSHLDAILRETVQELGQALGNTSVTFQLLNQPDGQKHAAGPHGSANHPAER